MAFEIKSLATTEVPHSSSMTNCSTELIFHFLLLCEIYKYCIFDIKLVSYFLQLTQTDDKKAEETVLTRNSLPLNPLLVFVGNTLFPQIFTISYVNLKLEINLT